MTFTPSHVNNTPAVCFCCGKHASGIGIGDLRRPADDPRFLCQECLLVVEQIKQVRRFDPYELQALDGGIDAVGTYLEQVGKTDLADMSEEEARMVVKAAWQGSADRLRDLVRKGEVPF